MKCTNCGREIENDSIFCEHCGAKVYNASNNSTPPSSIPTRPSTPTSNQQKQAPNTVAALVLGICSIIFGLYGGIILGIIGLVLSRKGYAAYNKAPEQYDGAGMLIGSMIMSIIGIIMGIIGFILIAVQMVNLHYYLL